MISFAAVATPRSPSGNLRRSAARHACAVLLAPLLLVMGLVPGVSIAPATAAGLSIELNKVQDNAGSCLAAFVFRNDLGHTLDRFSLDLYVFDKDGVIARQVLLDLAPLRNAKTTVANFLLIGSPCGDIGHVLVNDVPSCRAEDSGQDLDCLTGMSVSSRAAIELVK